MFVAQYIYYTIYETFWYLWRDEIENIKFYSLYFNVQRNGYVCACARAHRLQAGSWKMFMKGQRVKTVQAVFYESLSDISNTTVCETTWW